VSSSSTGHSSRASQPASCCSSSTVASPLLARGVGRKRLQELNTRAIEDGVNLALTLGDADESTRRWVAASALRSTPLAVWDRLML
jgi:hypothetical protein